MKEICNALFYTIEVRENGFINLCSLAFIDPENCVLGSIFERPFDELWNGERALKIRKYALEGKYPYCATKQCHVCYKIRTTPDIDDSGGFAEFINSYPTHVTFSHDFQCNVTCIFCRDCMRYNTPAQTKALDEKIEKYYLPLCKNAKIVKLQGSGEVFASRHSRNLVKAIAKKYPDVKFHIQSNGIMFDKKNLDELGITERLYKAVICAHAATKETYDKHVINGNFEAVMKNIEWLGELKKSGRLPHFELGFVVTAYNYQEMKDYVRLAQKHGALAYFVELRVENEPTFREEKRLAITDPRHPKHNHLIRLLKDDIFNSPDCLIDIIFKELEPVSLGTRIKNTAEYYRDEIKLAMEKARRLKDIYMDKYEKHKIKIAIKRRLKTGKSSFLIFPPTQGFGSFGDQAMLLATIRQLTIKYGNPKIGLLNYFEPDDFIPKYYPDVENLHLSLNYGKLNDESISQYEEILRNYDNLVLMGADVLDGFYNGNQVETFLKLAQIADTNWKNVKILGFSHNGNYDEFNIHCLKQLSEIATLNLRDEISLERLKNFGIQNLNLVADTAFLFDHRDYALGERAKEFIGVLSARAGKKFVGVNFHFAKAGSAANDDFIKGFAEALEILDKDKYELLLIPHDIRGEGSEYSDIESLSFMVPELEKRGFDIHFADWITTQIEAKAITEICDFVIGNRMHLAVSALCMGIPVISFVYQGKFEGLYEFYNFEQNLMFKKNEMDINMLKNAIVFITQNELQNVILQKNKLIISLAGKNF
jgi:polysaccharide pyruvyl transferase WcaK-like protein/MoaA/NifB/PqqE/SkfB family radical SAM enzyme